jgi:hypothetical protein
MLMVMGMNTSFRQEVIGPRNDGMVPAHAVETAAGQMMIRLSKWVRSLGSGG